MADFKVPEVGEGVHEGELVRWLVKEGDSVQDDQPLCEVMTDKATVEIPSPFHGNISKLLGKEGTTVKVGQVILQFEPGAGASAAVVRPQVTATVAAPKPIAAVSLPPIAPSAQVLAAPSTRKLAREAGVDLVRVSATGPGGRVLRDDVERFVRSGAFLAAQAGAGVAIRKATPAGGEKRVPLKGLRKKIAEKMRLSKDHAAHFTYVEEADATDLVRLRVKAKELGASQGIKVTYLPFIMKAMVAALKQFPDLNCTLDEEKGELVYKYYYNIGLSIQTDEGLTAPVAKDVEHKTILELARDIQDLVQRAHAKKLELADFHGGTITLTNAGSIGGLFATPVINYPEVAIMGFNKIFRKPVVKVIGGRERIVIRDWTYFSLTLDHRVVDGAVGAEFMKHFVSYIENPALLLLEGF